MKQKDREKFEKLAEWCAALLAQRERQSSSIFRGDMRAIVSAAKELAKTKEKA